MLQQKRQTRRFGSRYSILCEVDDTEFNATVIDLGAEGMRLAVPQKLESGTRLTVFARQDREGKGLELEVRWCQPKSFTSIIEVGCSYCGSPEGTWVESALKQLDSSRDERRNDVRAPILLPIQVNGKLAGNVENLGPGGVLVTLDEALEQGSEVTLRIGPTEGVEPLETRARIAHQTDGCFGLAFLPLSPEQTALLNRYLDLGIR